jgi:hypothetical protein
MHPMVTMMSRTTVRFMWVGSVVKYKCLLWQEGAVLFSSALLDEYYKEPIC